MSTLDHLERSPAGEALRRLREVEVRVASDREEARRVAASLPAHHEDVEVRAALARLTLRLARFGPASPDGFDPEPALRPLWDAAACAADAERAGAWSDARVLRALRHLSPSAVVQPALVLRRLARVESTQAVRALQWARESVALAAVTSERALLELAPLAEHHEVDARVAFADALAEPWLALADARAFVRRGLRDESPDVVRRALRMAEEDDAQRARELAEERELRADAALALARIGDAEDLARSLDVRRAVLAHHRAGRFPRDAHVPELVQAYLGDDGWTPLELARVTYTSRAALLDVLAAVPVDDVRWRRLAMLLAHVEGSSSSGERGRDLLATRLRASKDLDVACALLTAAAECPDFVDEEALLTHLEALPERTFDALRVHGTTRSLERVTTALRDPVAFGAARRVALDWCWLVAEDRVALIEEHGAESWTDAQLAGASAPPTEWIERTRRAVAGSDPGAALHALVGVGAPLAELHDAFRGAVRAETIAHGARRPRDPDALTQAERALLQRERALALDGRRVTRFQDEGGGRLIRAFALAWLADARGAADARDMVLALGVLARHPLHASQLRYVHPLWRHADRDVQRAAVEALLRCEHSEGLALSLSRLAEEEDVRPLRQGLRAIEHFAPRWAEPLAIAALGSPNMNVKKAAASALASVGTARCVREVLRWIAGHDNPGLRETLVEVLTSVAGEAADALLLESLEHAPPHHHANLLAVLDGRLDVRQVACLMERGGQAAERVAEACRAGAVGLARGSWADVLAEVHRAAIPAPVEPTAVDRLEREGFSPALALEALDEDPPQLRQAIRARRAEWARWACEAPETHARRAAHAVLSAMADIEPAQALRLAARAETPVEAWVASRALVAAASSPEHRHAAIGIARALPMLEHERWHVLGELRAVRTREELERSLDAAAAHGAMGQLLRALFPARSGELVSLPPPDRRARVLDAHLEGLPPRRRYEARPTRSIKTTLHAFLSGKTALPHDPRAREELAEALQEWPADERESRRALGLIPHLPLHRVRSWLPRWVERAEAGDEAALRLVEAVPSEELLAHAALSADQVSALVSRTLPRDARLTRTMRSARLGEMDVAPAPKEPDPVDPLDEVVGADALLEYALSARGREASRAIGRLGGLGAREHLLRLVDHPDSNPRTVALRWLRKLLDRDAYLALALERLGEERDAHLRRSLLRGVAHRRHRPSYPTLVALMLDRDRRIAREAAEAVRRLGSAIQGELDRAMAHERPDRARKLRAIVEAWSSD